jgi:hypothetical protein
MSIPIKFDERYKVNQSMVNEMRRLKIEEHLSNAKIAAKFGICSATVCYWVNEKYRKYQQQKNALRAHEPKEHVKQQVHAIKRFYSSIPDFKLAHDYYSAKAEKKSRRLTIHGKPMEEIEKFMDDFRKGGQKVF